MHKRGLHGVLILSCLVACGDDTDEVDPTSGDTEATGTSEGTFNGETTGTTDPDDDTTGGQDTEGVETEGQDTEVETSETEGPGTTTGETTGPTTGETTTETTSDATGSTGAGETCPEDWWDCEWSYRRGITIPAQDEALTAFPLRIALGNDFAYANTAPDGADVRFTDAEGTLLPYEVEVWTPDGASELWVRVPAISADDDTVLYMYYGNEEAPDASTPAAVWNGYAAVWHMTDLLDSAQDHALVGSEVEAVAGPIGDARAFVETDADYLQVESGTSLVDVFQNGGTISAWIYVESWGASNFGRIVDISTTDSVDMNQERSVGGYAFMVQESDFGDRNDASLRFGRGFTEGAQPWRAWQTPAEVLTGPDSPETQWHLVSVSYNDMQAAADPENVTPTFTVDGVVVAATPIETGDTVDGEPAYGAGSVDDNPFTIGARSANGNVDDGGLPLPTAFFFDGQIDEVRVVRTVRSEAWMAAEYANGMGTLITVGAEEEPTIEN